MLLSAALGDSSEPRSVLSVGSGPEGLPDWESKGYTVVRLDIDPATKPDILASMTDIGEVRSFDAVLCSHSLEHLYPHEVPTALSEFHRVLKPGGTLVVLVPDLEGVPATDDILPNGNGLCGLQLYYGWGMDHSPHMAHHCGFVSDTLKAVMEAAGFETRTERMGDYNLMGMGVKV